MWELATKRLEAEDETASIPVYASYARIYLYSVDHVGIATLPFGLNIYFLCNNAWVMIGCNKNVIEPSAICVYNP